MSSTASKLTNMTAAVPVVSLAVGGAAGRTAADIAADIDAACTSIGFFAVQDHGIDEAVLAAAMACFGEFFALPLHVKERHRRPCRPGVSRGYAGLGAEAQAAAVGIATRPDRSETYTLGPLRDPTIDDEFTAPDVWPDDDVVGFHAAVAAYRVAADQLGRRLATACAIALWGDPDALAPSLTQPLGALRGNFYPTLDAPLTADEWRAGAHTDYSTLTILATDGQPGLEILVDGHWRAVVAPPGALLVNVGDVLAALSRGRWRSTWHRVAPPLTTPARPRLSVAFFQYPNADAQIDGLVDADGRPCTAGEYLQAKVRLLFGR